ncbi:hypothetical protein BC940DRAFT_128215 [Gongronella butleri]|nr:hypothetical protein BC940DRAFT_128215 [Gongronella butleri]
MITFRPSVGDDPNRKSPAVVRRLIENRILLLTALTSSVGGLLFGYDQGVISSILEMQHFKEKFPMSSAEKGLLVSILEIGGFVGCYILGAITDKISRKYSTIVALVIFITGSTLGLSKLGI